MNFKIPEIRGKSAPYAVYTVLLGDYDEPKDPVYKEDAFDYFLFTDNPEIKSDFWRVILVEFDDRLLGSRYLKMLPHKFLPRYKGWFYIDASVQPMERLSHMFQEQLAKKNDFMGYQHYSRDCFEEAVNCLQKDRCDPETVKRQKLDYYDENVPRGLGFFQGGWLWRMNREVVHEFNEAWWAEFLKYPSRDQISMYKIMHSTPGLRFRPLDGFFPRMNFRNFQHKHEIKRSRERKGERVFYFVPWGPMRRLSDALNLHCAQVPDLDDWICIRDGDTCFLQDNWGDIILEAVHRYPDTGLFGCRTNRIGLDWQLYNGEFSEDPNILNHRRIAEEAYETHGSDCTLVHQPVAGLFQLFRKRTWAEAPYPPGSITSANGTRMYFDWAFATSVIERGLPVRVIDGLYLFHYYRMHKHKKDVTHIL